MDLPDWILDESSSERSPYIRILKLLRVINDGSDQKLPKHKSEDVSLQNFIITKDRSDQLSNTEENYQLLLQFIESKDRNLIDRLYKENSLTISRLSVLAIESGTPIEKITKYLTWLDFEHLTATIFRKAEWETRNNFRYFGEGAPSKHRSRYEIDVIAWKKPFVLLIDNKRHKTSSPSVLEKAADKQRQRAYELFEMIPLIHDLPELIWANKWKTAKLIPMVLSWKDHQIREYDHIPIIFSNSLLDLLINFNNYFETHQWFSLEWNSPNII